MRRCIAWFWMLCLGVLWTLPVRAEQDVFGLFGVDVPQVAEDGVHHLVEETRFLPYGAVDTQYQFDPGIPQESYGFTGKEAEPDFGVLYFGARFYNPHLGRWLSPDPLFLHVTSETAEKEQNLYCYTSNDPVNKVDPDGKKSIDVHFMETMDYVYKLFDRGFFPVKSELIVNPMIDGWIQAYVTFAFEVATSPKNAPIEAYKGARALLDGRWQDAVEHGFLAALNFMFLKNVAKQAIGKGAVKPTVPKLGPKPLAGGTGRGGTKLKPDPTAQGSHTTFKRDPQTGKVSGHSEWRPNPQNPLRFD